LEFEVRLATKDSVSVNAFVADETREKAVSSWYFVAKSIQMSMIVIRKHSLRMVQIIPHSYQREPAMVI
jgi:hypothetical protein